MTNLADAFQSVAIVKCIFEWFWLWILECSPLAHFGWYKDSNKLQNKLDLNRMLFELIDFLGEIWQISALSI